MRKLMACINGTDGCGGKYVIYFCWGILVVKDIAIIVRLKEEFYYVQ